MELQIIYQVLQNNARSNPVKSDLAKRVCMNDSRLIWPILLVLVLAVNIAPPAVQAISLPHELQRRKVIVIDPGHGGHDLGAVGPSGLAEKVVTLSVAHKIKEILFGDYEVHLTRNDDYGVDIRHRTALANHYRADIFISIHAGGGFRHRGRGVVVFCHDLREIGEEPVQWDHIQGVHRAKNQALAKLVHGHLLAKLGFMDRGVREAPCFVLQGADMPAILVEIGHLSHPADEKELSKPEVIFTAGKAICEAIKEYFTKFY